MKSYQAAGLHDTKLGPPGRFLNPMDPRYRKMLDGMREKEKARPRKGRREKWVLYILKCADSSLYTGITKDLERRFKSHSKGRGARYTRTRLPLEVVHQETCRSRTEALTRECAVKALPKAKKLALILKKNQTLLK